MGSRDPGTLYLCHGASQRRDQQHSPEKPADHYSPDRCPPLDPLSHHVVAASFDQDDHVLMNHSPCAVVSTVAWGSYCPKLGRFPERDLVDSGGQMGISFRAQI